MYQSFIIVYVESSSNDKNLLIFSDTSIATAIGISNITVKIKELKYFFKRYLSSIFILNKSRTTYLLFSKNCVNLFLL